MSIIACIDGERFCKGCETAKPLSEFHNDRRRRLGKVYLCKPCANAKTRQYHKQHVHDPKYHEKKRSSWVKRAHGIPLNTYLELLANQDFECAICGTKLETQGPRTHLDHDHQSGKFRGFLCTNCNRGLGHFQDSIKHLESAIKYLEANNCIN